jgi:hypothetical protein
MRSIPLDRNGHLLSEIATTMILVTSSDPPLITGSELYSECAMCGTSRYEMEVTPAGARMPQPCPVPDGITTSVTLAVPSGKIVVADDLRRVYSVNEDEMASYNSRLGQAQVTEAMAAIGCAYGAVGNTCPGLYRTGPGHYVIAIPAYDGDYSTTPDGWTYLGGIITDLWAYSIADYGDFTAKGGVVTHCEQVVDIPAGNLHRPPPCRREGIQPGCSRDRHFRAHRPERVRSCHVFTSAPTTAGATRSRLPSPASATSAAGTRGSASGSGKGVTAIPSG